MSPTLLLPAALSALVALAIPLAIHLARRSEMRPTDFAALRWLDPKPRPRSRLRFDEWPLLLARLVLLALVALWLARPALYGSADTTPWIAVVPGVDVGQITQSVARRHWLAPGFPPLDHPPPSGPIPVASLLRQLDAELPRGVTLTVVVPAEIEGADAERPRLSRAVAWRVVPGTMPAAAAAPQPVPGLTVRYAPGREAALRYLRAAAGTWQAAGHEADYAAAPSSQPLPASGNLVWLVPGPLPGAVIDWIRGGGTALVDAAATVAPMATTVVWHDDVGAPLVTAALLGRGRMLRLTRPLDPAAMPQLLEPDFPAQLRALFAAPPPAPSRVAAVALAPLTGGATYPQPARELAPWLALVIAAVLLVERWLATARRSRDPA